jgi:hypothetical protein
MSTLTIDRRPVLVRRPVADRPAAKAPAQPRPGFWATLLRALSCFAA